MKKLSPEQKEKARIRAREWHWANRERANEASRKYAAQNRAEAAAKARKWRAENLERARLGDRQKRKKMTPEVLEYWRRKRAVYEQNRRLRSKGELSPEIVERLLLEQKNSCAVCSVDISGGFELDHIMPLALGGAHEDANIQLLCLPCNRSKGARHPTEFLKSRGMSA